MQAFDHPIVAPPPAGFRGGPVLGDGPEDLKLRHRRYEAVADGFRPGEPCEDRVAGAVAYAGPLIPHFGHMVAEAVHRIVPARRVFNADRFLFAATHHDDLYAFERFPPWMRSLLGFLELDGSNCRVVKSNTAVEELQIVEQGDRLGEAVMPEYLDMLADWSAARLRRLHDEALPSDKVYVSRSAGHVGGATLGEAYLEAALREAGFWMFRPEEHPYPFQLHVYSRAGFLLFAEGSAVHGASLLGRGMMNRVAVLMRRPGVARQMRRVLAGRCAGEPQVGFCSTYLGTVVGNPVLEDRPAVDRGVSVYAVDALLQFLEGQGFYLHHLFDRRAYFEACERELLEYLRFFLNLDSPSWPKLGAAHFARLLSAFENARSSEVN